MKFLRLFSFLGLVITLAMSSCTMQKRVYSSGYHLEWNKSKRTVNKQEFANKENIKQTNQHKIAVLQQTENKNNSIGIIEKKQITKSENQKIIFLPHQQNRLINNAKTDTTFKKENVKNKTVLNNEDKKPTYNHFAVKGFIFSMIEIFFLISIFYAAPYSFAPALIAAFFLFLLFLLFTTLAIVYSVEGLQQLKKDKLKGKGLAIAGLIIVLFPIVVFIIGLLT